MRDETQLDPRSVSQIRAETGFGEQARGNLVLVVICLTLGVVSGRNSATGSFAVSVIASCLPAILVPIINGYGLQLIQAIASTLHIKRLNAMATEMQQRSDLPRLRPWIVVVLMIAVILMTTLAVFFGRATKADAFSLETAPSAPTTQAIAASTEPPTSATLRAGDGNAATPATAPASIEQQQDRPATSATSTTIIATTARAEGRSLSGPSTSESKSTSQVSRSETTTESTPTTASASSDAEDASSGHVEESNAPNAQPSAAEATPALTQDDGPKQSEQTVQPLQALITMNPVPCDGVTHSIGFITGASSDERMSFTSPGVANIADRVANGSGTVGLFWSCGATGSWSVLATGHSGGQSVAYHVNGSEPEPAPEPVTLTLSRGGTPGACPSCRFVNGMGTGWPAGEEYWIRCAGFIDTSIGSTFADRFVGADGSLSFGDGICYSARSHEVEVWTGSGTTLTAIVAAP